MNSITKLIVLVLFLLAQGAVAEDRSGVQPLEEEDYGFGFMETGVLPQDEEEDYGFDLIMEGFLDKKNQKYQLRSPSRTAR